jgi:hypothetical protein
MRQLSTFLLLCAVVVLSAAVLQGRGSGSQANPPNRAGIPGIEPTVYFSNSPNLCIFMGGLEYWVFVHSPEDDGFTGVSLDLDLHGTAITTPSVTAEDGVTLVAADVSAMPYHLEAVWTSRPLDHEPIVKLRFDADPVLGGFQEPMNVELTGGSGGSGTGVGLASFANCCITCMPCSHGLYVADHVMVPIGGSAQVGFEWDWNCYTYGGNSISVTDTRGWVVSWTPTYAFDVTTCGPCFNPRFPGSIVVTIPEEIAAGTTSTMTLIGLNDSKTIVLEAEDKVPARPTTWGSVKALYDL